VRIGLGARRSARMPGESLGGRIVRRQRGCVERLTDEPQQRAGKVLREQSVQRGVLPGQNLILAIRIGQDGVHERSHLSRIVG
jgi:hypothetical protein